MGAYQIVQRCVPLWEQSQQRARRDVARSPTSRRRSRRAHRERRHACGQRRTGLCSSAFKRDRETAKARTHRLLRAKNNIAAPKFWCREPYRATPLSQLSESQILVFLYDRPVPLARMHVFEELAASTCSCPVNDTRIRVSRILLHRHHALSVPADTAGLDGMPPRIHSPPGRPTSWTCRWEPVRSWSVAVANVPARRLFARSS